jgi:tripartite-type tricarboxylate transporter receptor subunit TctC
MQKKIKFGKLVLCWSVIFLVIPLLGFECLYAQGFPAKPLTVIVPFGPGGQSDLMNRAIMPYIPEYFGGQPFVLHFRTGGGGAIGSNEAAQAKPDGYTMLSGHANSQSVLVAVEGRGKGPDDLAAVARVTRTFSAYWVRSDAPWKTLPEMISWAKANPDKLTNGNTGTWSSTDFGWRWLEMKAGFTSRNVPFEGGAEGLVALLGGHVHIGRFNYASTLAHHRAGKIRPLAVAGSVRHKELPEVPCLVELGYDMGEVGGSWMGYFVPKGTPRPIIDRLASGFEKITKDKRAEAAMNALRLDFAYLGPDEFLKVWREEYLSYKELAKIFKK